MKKCAFGAHFFIFFLQIFTFPPLLKTSTIGIDTGLVVAVSAGGIHQFPVDVLSGMAALEKCPEFAPFDQIVSSFRVIVPDHLGCGKSDRVVGDDAWFPDEQHSQNLRNLIEALDLKNARLCNVD